MLKFQVHVNQGQTQAAQTHEVLEGQGAKGQPLRLKTKAGAKYQLVQLDAQAKSDKVTALAPDEVKVKRVGKHLHVFLDGSTEVDLILEEYYAVMPDGYNGLIGQAENGAFHEYVPVVPEVSNLIPELLDGANTVTVALGAAEVSGSGAAVGLLAVNPLLSALGVASAGAAAAISANTVTSNTNISIAATGALSADSDTAAKGDNLTRIAQPKISGQTTAGAQVLVKLLNAQGDEVATYTTTADTDGNYVVNVASNLIDGTYTPEMTVTTAAGATSAPIRGTAFTVDTTAPGFNSLATADVDENVSALSTIDTALATDAQTVSYSLKASEGDAASFSIDPAVGLFLKLSH